MKTAFDVIEARMANRYAQRPNGWPVGPEKRIGGGWSTPTRSVQIIEIDAPPRKARFLVYTFFPFLRIDLRYPAIRCKTHWQARQVAFARMRAASGDAKLIAGRSGSIDLWRAGGVVGLEWPR